MGAAVPAVAADSEEATALIAALLAGAGVADGAVETLARADHATAAARRLLEHLRHDPDTAEPVSRILADPPADAQLSVEAAATVAVVLGALITWLQTKVDIQVTRKDGKTEFEFRLTKDTTDSAGIRRIVEVVSGVLTGTGPRP